MSNDAFTADDLPRPTTEKQGPLGLVGRIRAATSDLIQRARIANVAGLTYSGSRDLYNALGYPRVLEVKDHRDRYKRGDVAARVVDVYPKETWRGGAELIEDEDPEVVTDFEDQWDQLNKRLHVWQALQRTDILAGLGRYAVLMIGAPGLPETPLGKLSGPDDVLYLASYCEDEAIIAQLVENPEDPRFGLPETYTIRRTGSTKSFDRRVHWSRVLHVADGVLDEVIYGAPRLERVWNRLDDLDKVVGGGSEAFWIRVHQGFALNVDPTIKISQPEVDKLKEEVDEFIHGFRRFLTMRGTELNALGGDVSNFGPQVASLLSLISGATGIPQRLLLGSERGELASTQDAEAWEDRVSDRRDSFAEPIVRELVTRFQGVGALPEAEFEVRWPEIEELNTKEKAEVAERWAGLNSKAKGIVVLPAEIRDRVLGLEELTPEQIAEAEEEKKANTPPPPGAPAEAEDEDGDGDEGVETRVRVEE